MFAHFVFSLSGVFLEIVKLMKFSVSVYVMNCFDRVFTSILHPD